MHSIVVQCVSLAVINLRPRKILYLYQGEIVCHEDAKDHPKIASIAYYWPSVVAITLILIRYHTILTGWMRNGLMAHVTKCCIYCAPMMQRPMRQLSSSYL